MTLRNIVKMIPDEDLEQLKSDFDILDTDKTGVIYLHELKSAFKNSK